jgi:hypothetical protein
MNTLIFGVMLAVSLTAGITTGARLGRAENGFLKSFVLAALLFVGIIVANLYLQDQPGTLACLVAAIASTLAAWIGAKSVPDYLRSAHLRHDGSSFDSSSGSAGNKTPANNTFGSNRPATEASKALAGWVRQLPGFRKRELPSRVTPTGKKIRLVSSNDVVQGKRRKGHLKSAS